MAKSKSLRKRLSRFLRSDPQAAQEGGDARGLSDIGLYVHIPFCRARCSYCDFVRHAVGSGDRQLFERYVRRLVDEAKEHVDALYEACGTVPPVRTLYVGGGTPTVIDVDLLGQLVAELRAVFGVWEVSEATVEANPESLTDDVARALREAGFDRLSLGVQSLRDEELRVLGRIHDVEGARAAFGRARALFPRLSCDLIYGLPGQTVEDFESSLRTLISWRPEGISCYALTLEPSVPLAKFLAAEGQQLPDGDELYALYLRACALLREAGYVHYEVSNWVLPGHESRHNQRYWERKPYLGLGASASSSLGRLRFTNVLSPEEYASGAPWAYEFDELDEEEEALELLYLGLRTASGISLARLDAYAKLWHSFMDAIARLESNGYLERKHGQLRATEKGWFVLDSIVVELTR